jgi:hypothetical protein
MLFSKCCHFSRGGYSAKYDEKIKHFGSTKRKSKKERRGINERRRKKRRKSLRKSKRKSLE